MNRQDYFRLIASFLVALVISIPLNFAIVYAAINSVSAKGSDGVEGLAKSQDTLTFTVTASSDSGPITKERVSLGTTLKFDKCTGLAENDFESENDFECTLKFPKTGKETFEAKAIPYTINLYRINSTTIEDSLTGSFIIDNKAPEVKLDTLKNKFSSEEQIVVNYEATDFACDDPSCSNACVGLKSIDIYTIDGSFKQSIDGSNITNTCNIKSSVTIEAKKLKNGKNSVLAKATDKFGKVSPESSVNFEVDLLGPKILVNTFEITRKGIKLYTYSPRSVPVEVSIRISANDLDVNSVTADLSVLNPNAGLENVKGFCSSIGTDLYLCKGLIELNPGTTQSENIITGSAVSDSDEARADRDLSAAGSSKSIVISASDLLGNKETVKINKALVLDDKGPMVQLITVGRAVKDKIFVKSAGNRVVVNFDDASGIDKNDAFLHIGNSRIAASSCNKESNWVCIWDNVNFGGSSHLSVKSDTLDILLNPATETKVIEVTVDSSAPALIGDINLIPVGSLSSVSPDLFKVEDKIGVEANISEQYDVSATADFSRFIKDAVNVPGTCQKIQGNRNTCIWLSEPITSGGSDSIKFNFSDPSGNELIVKKQLKVLGLDTTPVPDFWTSSVRCSPNPLDRQLGTFINQRVFCEVNLQPKLNAQVSTVAILQGECTGDTSLIQSVETFNTQSKSTAPLLKITLKKDPLKIDNIKLKCALGIISRVGDAITKNPEVEDADIKIEFYNLPLGEISEGIQDKINEAKESAKGAWKTIGTLNKIVDLAKKICQFIHVIYNFVSIYHLFVIKLKIVEASTPPPFDTPVTVAAGTSCATAEGLNQGADNFKQVNNYFCDWVTCRKTPLWGQSVKDFFNKAPGLQSIASDKNGGTSYYDPLTGKRYGIKPVSDFMNPQNSIVTASLFACVPGMIYGLDKWRQIQCLFADCLENAVRDGLPPTACNEMKAYAKCKYVTGEIFAVVPWTAVFDHFTGIIKYALSNPVNLLGLPLSIYCVKFCTITKDGGVGYNVCRGARIISLLGDSVENVRGMVHEGFKIRQDYCSRIDNEDNEEEQEGEQEQQQSQSSSGTRTASTTQPQAQGTR